MTRIGLRLHQRNWLGNPVNKLTRKACHFAALKKTRLFGDAFWALSGQIASALALLAGTRMLTELVAPDVFGQVALLNGFVALGVAVFSYPYICAGMRILPECRSAGERQALFKQVYRLTFRSVVLAVFC